MILKCNNCQSFFVFKNDKYREFSSLKVRCSVCRTVYCINPSSLYANDKQAESGISSVKDERYSGEYLYYTEMEKEFLKKRDYFEFRDESMSLYEKRVDHIAEKEDEKNQKKPYVDAQSTLEKKAEDDFKLNRITIKDDSEEFVFDDNFCSASEFDIDSEFSVFDSGYGEVVATEKNRNNFDQELYEWFIDGLEPFEEEVSNDELWDVETDADVSKEDRAYQIAESTCQLIDWTGRNRVDLLAKIFFENGWSLNRTRLVREIKAGMTYEMVKLAVEVRALWNRHAEFRAGYYKGWISDVHTNVEWRFCHSLISIYSSLPNADEVEVYLLELFDSWYCSDLLRKLFLTFYDYIKYRTTSGLPFDMSPDIPFEENPSESFLHYTNPRYSFLEF